ncbi:MULTISPECIES: ABC transporter ATP-binding protein [unclassified Frankia]|uniref:ABC transporter ATP-binding protein n=1 Tax=unclassified Frankia TaxID=2632575 RepID=UPI001EF53C55|nr:MULTISPECIES: ABC transporter ATP-binding protein [unclassified Frankia]
MIKNDLAVYRRLLPMLRPYRARLFLILTTSAAGPLFMAGRIWLLKVLIDDVLHHHHAELVPLVAVGFVAVAVARALLSAATEQVSGRVGTHVVRDLRVRTYESLQGQSLRYFHQQRLGDLLTRLSGDTAAIEDLLVTGLTDLVGYTVTILLFLSLLIVLDPVLVLVGLSILPALAVVAAVGARRSRRAQEEIREHSSQLISTAEEGLSAIALVKAFARGSYEQSRFADASGRSASARLRAVRVRAVYPLVADVVAATGTAAVVWVGAHQVLANRLSLGSLVIFISYLASLYTPMHGLSRLSTMVQRALVGAARVLEITETPGRDSRSGIGPSNRRVGRHALTPSRQRNHTSDLRERHGQPWLPPVVGKAQFDRVTFAYVPGRDVLQKISIQISPGETVALIGASGAGKTTVVSLLLSYYDADEGEVRLDGHPLHAFDPDSCRRQVAAALHEPMLFDASVRDNIRYGRLNASDADIKAAAQVAQAESFVMELPDGYDTVVGPRGSRLSAGQRQRLAIARAVVKNAPVLLLDEATSALDPATETMVFDGLRERCLDQAILLVAHRFSTVSHADRVIVLDSGRIVEEGTHDHLLARKGAYWNFLLSQDRRVLGASSASTSELPDRAAKPQFTGSH